MNDSRASRIEDAARKLLIFCEQAHVGHRQEPPVIALRKALAVDWVACNCLWDEMLMCYVCGPQCGCTCHTGT